MGIKESIIFRAYYSTALTRLNSSLSSSKMRLCKAEKWSIAGCLWSESLWWQRWLLSIPFSQTGPAHFIDLQLSPGCIGRSSCSNTIGAQPRRLFLLEELFTKVVSYHCWSCTNPIHLVKVRTGTWLAFAYRYGQLDMPIINTLSLIIRIRGGERCYQINWLVITNARPTVAGRFIRITQLFALV